MPADPPSDSTLTTQQHPHQQPYNTRKKSLVVQSSARSRSSSPSSSSLSSHSPSVPPTQTPAPPSTATPSPYATRSSLPSIDFPPPHLKDVVRPEDAADPVLMACCAALTSVDNRALCAKELAEVCVQKGWIRSHGVTPFALVSTCLRNHLRRSTSSAPPYPPLLDRFDLTGAISQVSQEALGIDKSARPAVKRGTVWFLSQETTGWENPFKRSPSQGPEPRQRRKSGDAVSSATDKTPAQPGKAHRRSVSSNSALDDTGSAIRRLKIRLSPQGEANGGAEEEEEDGDQEPTRKRPRISSPSEPAQTGGRTDDNFDAHDQESGSVSSDLGPETLLGVFQDDPRLGEERINPVSPQPHRWPSPAWDPSSDDLDVSRLQEDFGRLSNRTRHGSFSSQEDLSRIEFETVSDDDTPATTPRSPYPNAATPIDIDTERTKADETSLETTLCPSAVSDHEEELSSRDQKLTSIAVSASQMQTASLDATLTSESIYGRNADSIGFFSGLMTAPGQAQQAWADSVASKVKSEDEDDLSLLGQFDLSSSPHGTELSISSTEEHWHQHMETSDPGEALDKTEMHPYEGHSPDITRAGPNEASATVHIKVTPIAVCMEEGEGDLGIPEGMALEDLDLAWSGKRTILGESVTQNGEQGPGPASGLEDWDGYGNKEVLGICTSEGMSVHTGTRANPERPKRKKGRKHAGRIQ